MRRRKYTSTISRLSLGTCMYTNLIIIKISITAATVAPCYIVWTSKIISHCNSTPWTNHRKQYERERKWNSTPMEWLFLPFGQAWTDTVNLAEMWRVIEIMAFLRERNRKNGSDGRSERLRGRVRQTHPSHSLVSLPLTDHFQFF